MRKLLSCYWLLSHCTVLASFSWSSPPPFHAVVRHFLPWSTQRIQSQQEDGLSHSMLFPAGPTPQEMKAALPAPLAHNTVRSLLLTFLPSPQSSTCSRTRYL